MFRSILTSRLRSRTTMVGFQKSQYSMWRLAVNRRDRRRAEALRLISEEVYDTYGFKSGDEMRRFIDQHYLRMPPVPYGFDADYFFRVWMNLDDFKAAHLSMVFYLHFGRTMGDWHNATPEQKQIRFYDDPERKAANVFRVLDALGDIAAEVEGV